jgi:carbamoyl-phosphate synthase large subunit
LKFGVADPRLGTEMRAVGESLGLGRTFAEAFLKALAGREQTLERELDLSRRSEPVPERWDLLLESARRGLDLPGVHEYFADEVLAIAAAERELAAGGDVAAAKRFGLPDATVARVLEISEDEVRSRRARPGRLAVDSCAAEFEAKTPYFYLSYEASDHVPQGSRPAIVILGSGPNRIGQGIEFDYCCSRAAGAFRRLGYETVLLNSNPETVSTDYDTSDRLYLEPLTLERALDVCELEQPEGVVVQLGGQTPLTLAPGVAAAGFPLLGDPMRAIEHAEDRGRFGALLGDLGLRAPAWGTATTGVEARAVAERIGYPVLVRPHHVLGGRGMRVVRGPEELDLGEPALVDQFLEGALELDVDILCDGESVWLGGILEHVEPAGVHSGDSACVIPAPSVTPALEAEIHELSAAIAAGLGARGLLNLQLALHLGELYVLEANPRASRTIPFLAKATGIPLVDHACRLLLGAELDELDLPTRTTPTRAWAKEAVFPEDRFANAADRGPEMRATGEVMASGENVSQAYARALRASGRARRGGSIGVSLQAAGGTLAATLVSVNSDNDA